MKLTVVVTCSDRKSQPSTPDLRVRSLPPGSIQQRSDSWIERLALPRAGVRLDALYCGEHWTQVKRLMRTATGRGVQPDLWIASAGLGLQPASAVAPAYGSTFTRGHPDSVSQDIPGMGEWWRALQDRRGRATLAELARRSPLLIVFSEAYGRAIHAELQALADLSPDVVLFGGAQEVPGLARIPADRRLRGALGGTLTSLNTRMAVRWLEHGQDGRLSAPSAFAAWRDWAESVGQSEQYHRRTLTDEAVISFIRSFTNQSPQPSRSRLLRKLRDKGMACEQRRFAMLHARALEMT
jgi:hypothetical protein